MHSYSVEDGFALVNRLVAAVVEVYTVAVEPTAGVAWAGSVRLMHSEVVPGAEFLVVAGSVCCYLVQLALGSP